MRAPTGTFSSMNYPNPYPNDRECSWSIEVDPGNRVELSILDQDIEPSENCTNDALRVISLITLLVEVPTSFSLAFRQYSCTMPWVGGKGEGRGWGGGREVHHLFFTVSF